MSLLIYHLALQCTSNIPANYLRVLAGLEWKSCLVYIDNVLVASKKFQEHLNHMREVFLRFHAANLELKTKKNSFLRPTSLSWVMLSQIWYST